MARRLEFETVSSQFHFSGGLLFQDTFCAVVSWVAVPPARGCRRRAAKDYSSCEDLTLSGASLPLLALLMGVHDGLLNILCGQARFQQGAPVVITLGTATFSGLSFELSPSRGEQTGILNSCNCW